MVGSSYPLDGRADQLRPEQLEGFPLYRLQHELTVGVVGCHRNGRHQRPLPKILAETEVELRAVAQAHGMSLDGVRVHEVIPDESLLDPGEQYTVLHPSEVELGETNNMILKLVEEKHGDLTLVGYRFPEDVPLRGDTNDLRFNFSPCFVADARGRTLEIGAGSGLNLAHYPEHVTELVLSEPSLHMLEQLRSQIRVQPPRVSSWELVQAGAEELPFDDGSFDTAVGTYVLCSVEDPARVLREVSRVLRPGGHYLYLEHVRAGEGTVLGTLIGCLIMSVLNNGCVHAGIPNASQDVIIGAIIVAAVTLDRFRRRRTVAAS